MVSHVNFDRFITHLPISGVIKTAKCKHATMILNFELQFFISKLKRSKLSIPYHIYSSEIVCEGAATVYGREQQRLGDRRNQEQRLRRKIQGKSNFHMYIFF